MTDCQSNWYAGLTCDHLYEDCTNRLRAKAALQRSGWWDTGSHGRALHTFIDPHGGDICGMCLHRHNRAEHKESA